MSASTAPSTRPEVAPGSVLLIERKGYTNDVFTHRHQVIADEPVEVIGAADEGPAPFELLLASLGACTNMTLRMYATRKQLPLDGIRTLLSRRALDDNASSGGMQIDRQVELIGAKLTAEQRARLLEIAQKCPVHRALTNPIAISTAELKTQE